jgi:Outer membrane protein beta-barrel domain
LYLLVIFSPLFAASQQDSVKPKPKVKTFYFGLKAGLNYSNVTNASSISASGQTGYHAGVLVNLGGKLISFRLELLYSQQGYNFSTDSGSGSEKHDYISMSQLIGINISRFVQIQVGSQTGYLLNATAESNSMTTGNASADQILSYYNRFDYGFSAGVEVHPIVGLLVGARYNLSFSNLYKNVLTTPSGGTYNYNVDFKNNVVQLFLGYRF